MLIGYLALSFAISALTISVVALIQIHEIKKQIKR